MSKRVIFMGTPEISAIYLQSLIDDKINIVGVFSQPPRKKDRGMRLHISPVHNLALENNIKIFFPVNLNLHKVLEDIRGLRADIIIVMGYGIKLPQPILTLPEFGSINIHVSLLPRWRGAAPIEHSILNGDKETGVTIFKLEEKMDAGPIFAQDSITIKKNDNKESLTKKLNNAGVNLLRLTLKKIFLKEITLKKQDENEVTYAGKIISDNRKLDFNTKIDEVDCKIRAFAPYPGAWFFYDNERIKILEAQVIPGDWQPAIILNNKFHIGCKNGKICPNIIQREGKKPMQLSDFLRGFKFPIGFKLNA
jgi:methionyl-tRNA formyltransferase